MSSWVIVNNKTGSAVFETFEKKTADKVANESTTHTVIPIMEWLIGLNK